MSRIVKFVLDSSCSMTDICSFNKSRYLVCFNSMINLIKKLDDSVNIGLSTFGNEYTEYINSIPKCNIPNDNNANRIIRNLSVLEPSDNSTKLYRAIYLASQCRSFDKNNEKNLVVFTDGEDNDNRRQEYMLEAIHKINSNKIKFHIITINEMDKDIKLFCRNVNGFHYHVNNIDDMFGSINKISNQLCVVQDNSTISRLIKE